MRLIAAVILMAVSLAAQTAPREVVGIQMPSGWKVHGVAAVDVNQDGLLDLVATATRRGDETQRILRVHLRREGGGFAAAPDHELTLHKDFTAFLVADVLAEPGLEVVLFSGSRALAWLPGKTGREMWVSLFRAHFILQLPRSGRVLYLPDLGQDLDGDGRLDFLIPLNQGYGVYLQKAPGQFKHQGDLLLPPPRTVEERNQGGSISVRKRSLTVKLRVPELEKARSGRTVKPNLIETNEWAWRPQVVDFDGNGSRDLLVRGSHELFVWKNVAGHAGARPDLRYKVPVVADRSRLVDLAYSSHFLDLNGDRRIDSVMVAGDQRADTPRAQILVFEQGAKRTTAEEPLFGPKGLPSQLLVLAGFTGATDLVDVNGDKLPDLVMVSLRQDIIDKLRESVRKKTEVEFYVYLNRGGTFSRSPDVRRTFEMKLEGLGALKSGFLARFMPDITGDGIAELVTRTRPERLDVHYIRQSRNGGLEILDRPLWTLPLSRYADLFVIEASAKESAGILIVEAEAVTIVRFK